MPRFVSVLTVWLLSPVAFAAPQPPPVLLPQGFSGWSQTGPARSSSSIADSPDAAVLREYGVAQVATATYASGSNRLTVRALRFRDATGAFGAFTFYRQPQMHPENIARAGAAAGDHYLVWTGATVLDATFSRAAADERSLVSALARQIPQPPGAEGVPPSLPRYLPTKQLDPASVRYAIGPAAWERLGGAIPADAIDFSQDAEAVSARYGAPGAQGALTLIMYPTPQIAAAHLKTIAAGSHTENLIVRRSGPLLAVLSGNYPNRKQLLDQIRFNDYVTINHPEGYVSEAVKVSRLLLGIAALTGILLAGALLLGLFLGGGRAMIRMMLGKPASSVTEEEFISLHLGG
jgi:hypothetical protein